MKKILTRREKEVFDLLVSKQNGSKWKMIKMIQ